MEKLKRTPSWNHSLEYIKQNSPSARDGITYEDELRQQAKGVKFIVSVSSQLKLPAATIYTAAIYLHRFYSQISLNKIHAYEGAGACVFLAAKTEETARRIKEVAAACTRIASKNHRMVIDENSKDLARWVDSIMYTEEILLESLYFDLDITSPYEALGKQLKLAGVTSIDEFGSLATDFINDSCRTFLSLRFPSNVISAAGLYWASKKSALPKPNDDDELWFKKDGLEEETLIEAINDMSDMINIVRNGQIDGQTYEHINSEVASSTEPSM